MIEKKHTLTNALLNSVVKFDGPFSSTVPVFCRASRAGSKRGSYQTARHISVFIKLKSASPISIRTRNQQLRYQNSSLNALVLGSLVRDNFDLLPTPTIFIQ